LTGTANNIISLFDISTGNITQNLNTTDPILSTSAGMCGITFAVATRNAAWYIDNEYGDQRKLKFDDEVSQVDFSRFSHYVMILNSKKQIEI